MTSYQYGYIIITDELPNSVNNIEGGEKMFNNLRNLLRTKNISIAAYSRILGCNEKTVQNKLNGTTEFTLSEIKATLDIFPEFKLEYLFAVESQPA